MNAQTRRQLIRTLLSEREVRSQQELSDLLAAEGVETTQPMLSRDLRSLAVAKRDGRYHLADEERVTPLAALTSLLRSVQPAGPHLVVVRCEPGAASAVARALEAEGLDGVVGTVAGDDSIFVAVDAQASGDRVQHRVRTLLEPYQ